MGDWITGLAKGVTGILGGAADTASTALRNTKDITKYLPGGIGLLGNLASTDFGVSETLSGGRKTGNTGAVQYSVNPFTEGFYKQATSEYPSNIDLSSPTTTNNPNNIRIDSIDTPPSNVLGNGGASSNTQIQANPLLASLDSLPTILANKNRQSDEEYGRAKASFDAQDILDRQNFDQNTFQNENTLTKNNQAALLNAANASTGLRGVLAGMGGLSGSGLDIIKRLTGMAANADTGNARQTFDTNATNLNSAWGQAEQTQRQRRQDADATLANSKQNNEAGVLTSRQNIFQQLANLFGAGTGEGNSYAAKASALAAPIAATTRATVAPYATPSASFSPAALQSYLAGTQNLNASATDTGAPINSPVYSSTKKKDQLTGVA